MPTRYAALGELYNTKDLEAADRSLAEALECHPWHILSLNQLGNLHKTRKEWTEGGGSRFDRVLALSPQFEMARLNKAEMSIRKREDRGIHLAARLCAPFTKLQTLSNGWHGPAPNDPGTSVIRTKLTPLLRRLAPYANNRKQLVEQYRNFRTNEAAGRYLALTEGEKSWKKVRRTTFISSSRFQFSM